MKDSKTNLCSKKKKIILVREFFMLGIENFITSYWTLSRKRQLTILVIIIAITLWTILPRISQDIIVNTKYANNNNNYANHA